MANGPKAVAGPVGERLLRLAPIPPAPISDIEPPFPHRLYPHGSGRRGTRRLPTDDKESPFPHDEHSVNSSLRRAGTNPAANAPSCGLRVSKDCGRPFSLPYSVRLAGSKFEPALENQTVLKGLRVDPLNVAALYENGLWTPGLRAAVVVVGSNPKREYKIALTLSRSG